MKKLIIALVFAAAVLPVYAQYESGENPNTYYLNVTVEKIYPSNQGYIIQYRGHTRLFTVGIPNAWFGLPSSRADIVRLPGGANWPSMSVFYSDGEFSHVRLYVHPDKGHITWGNIPMGTDVSRFFNEDGIDLQF